MNNRKISTILVVVGLMVISYPKISEVYLRYRQEQLMKEWEKSLSLIDDNIDAEEDITMIEGDPEPQVDLEEGEGEIEDRQEEFKEKGIEGMLSIDKIDLSLPILKGSTKANLRKSVASVDKTGSLGGVGNYVIAGHRNRTYGSIFNRLDEVEIGDQIGLNNGVEQYNYEVVEKLYVKPEEIWVLAGNQVSTLGK